MVDAIVAPGVEAWAVTGGVLDVVEVLGGGIGGALRDRLTIADESDVREVAGWKRQGGELRDTS